VTRPVLPDPLPRALPAWPEEHLRLIERAYHVAAYWHRGQQRKSGDPYITHPVAVAAIVAELGADHEVVCAALLHDVVEDTRCTAAELRAEFGDTICGLVHGVMTYDRAECDSGDPRILTLKLADRLHNMRTARFLPEEKQRHKSVETLEYFAPLAARLGMGTISAELTKIAEATLRAPRTLCLSESALTAAALFLPAAVRARWIEEWLGELHTLTACGQARFTGRLLCGTPRLAITLHRRSLFRLIRWILASDVRTWGLLAPFVAWMVIETGIDNPGDAVASLITVPPVLIAGVERLRRHLGIRRREH
jgi:hypothetical protein